MGFLGGLVNSTVTVTELANRFRAAGARLAEVTFRAIVLATLAMLFRNAVILGLLAPLALASSIVPLGVMAAGTAAMSMRGRRTGLPPLDDPLPDGAQVEPVPALESPFALTAALKFGALFLALQVAGNLAERSLGAAGFYAVSLAGGTVSSASAVAAAANLAASGALPPHVAGAGAIIACLVSAAINLPVVARLGRNPALTRRVAWALGGIVVLGLAGAAVQTAVPLDRVARQLEVGGIPAVTGAPTPGR